ncbi:MAG TPA: hypothetical protein VFD32_14005 [Dehalococcoidia bacterium]|nr:hypothetical protein [Dehalococcoidia bacterium]
MIDDLYVFARLRDLSTACAQIAAERNARAVLAAASASAPGSRAAHAPLCETIAPLARA